MVRTVMRPYASSLPRVMIDSLQMAFVKLRECRASAREWCRAARGMLDSMARRYYGGR